MSIEARVKSLQSKHQNLDAQISAEEKRPAPDGAVLKTLKREKLHIKEQIERFRKVAS